MAWHRSSSRVSLLAGAALVMALAPRAGATWSIVAIDTATGEVAVGTATCLPGTNMRFVVPVIQVGIGAAAAQASIDGTSVNRQLIFNELAKGTAPAQILALLAAADSGHQSRQYGIADLAARTATFTGTDTLAWAGGVTGQQGTIHYAIQGNILTGQPVVASCEAAFLAAGGDLAAKLMAGMWGAQVMGGDGRCSCDQPDATACGSPPPSFEKSAHVGVMIVARVGDQNGTCGGPTGCANGKYYMMLNYKGAIADPDAVVALQEKFDAWRLTLTGRPDHVLSQKSFDVCVLPADGASVSTLTMKLKDWQGQPLLAGGAAVTVTHAPDSDLATSIGAVTDLGDGRYQVPLTAGMASGRDRFEIRVDDGLGLPVTLYPFPELSVAPADALATDVTQVSSSAGDDVGLLVSGGPGLGGRTYVILASLTGTAPGFQAGKVTVPLVFDQATWYSFVLCGSPIMPGTCGVLDANGAGAGAILLAPNNLAAAVGGTMWFSLVATQPVDYASTPVSVDIAP